MQLLNKAYRNEIKIWDISNANINARNMGKKVNIN
jgi:hypothetical protein